MTFCSWLDWSTSGECASDLNFPLPSPPGPKSFARYFGIHIDDAYFFYGVARNNEIMVSGAN